MADVLSIDLHTHILPPEWPDLKSASGYGGWVDLEKTGPGCGRLVIDGRHFRDICARSWDPATRLAECDAHLVQTQVLSTVPVMFNYWAQPKDCLSLARYLNDHIASVVAAHPGRFEGLGTLPMQDPELAIGELERCMRDLGLRGVEIGSHVNAWNLDAEELMPFYEAAESLGAAIFVHPWEMMGRDEMPKHWLPWLVGMPAETARAACSLVFGGVLERFPRLRVALAHGGGSFPFTIGRIDHGHQVRPDLCATVIEEKPSRYLDRLYVDSLVHDPKALRYLVDLLGAERIALGSDYPFPLGEHVPGSLVRSMGDLTDAQKARILAGTAREFLGIDAPATIAAKSCGTKGCCG
ncbi:MAG: amidohydrolase family protein [Phycisphaerales bacterium]|jgi:aminocarboxymuconate-semialdehyde decarboxylase